MIVGLSALAEGDLERIGDWIARDNPIRAESFVAELRAKCHAIGRQPEVYQRVSMVDHSEVRRCVFGRYLIFFEIEPNRVSVLRILHGARDYRGLGFSN